MMPGPIADDELDALLGPVLARFRVLVLAVSGGVDSMALMLLVARWLRARAPDGRPRTVVATFDHGLRPEAAEEAAVVARQAARLGLDHVTLHWEGPKPATGLQDAARTARYRALGDLAREQAGGGGGGPFAVVTAHHQADQAETVLMRLARGSGVDGLAGMAQVRWVTPDRFAIVRPLLDTQKQRLEASVVTAGVAWCEDPSNQSSRFERVRMRQAAPALRQIGLCPDVLALTARRLARASAALAEATAAAEARLLLLNGGAFARVSRRGLAALAEDLRVRMLARILFAYGGQSTPPGLAQVEALSENVLRQRSGWRTTLGGCLVGLGPRHLVIHREPGRDPFPILELQPGESRIWDRRFVLAVAPRARAAVEVRALDSAQGREMAAACAGLSPAAAATLPLGWVPPGEAQKKTSGRLPLVQATFIFPRLSWD